MDLQHRDRNGLLSDAVTRKVTVSWAELPGAVYITSIVKNEETGVITITYNTGNTITFGSGKGIKSITRNEATGIVTITYTDGSSETIAIQDGAAGGKAEWIYRGSTSSARPATPVTTEAQDSILDFVPSGWNDSPPNSSYVWVSTRRRALVTEAYSKFSTPAQFRGPQGARGATGAVGPPGPMGPREWQLIFEKSVDGRAGYQNIAGKFQSNSDNGTRFTVRSNMDNYDWIAVFGRGWVGSGHSAFAWSGMIKVSELKAQSTRNTSPHNTLEIQSTSTAASTYLVFVRYVSNTTLDFGVTAVNLTGDTSGYLDEIYGVEAP